jgi:hypothetical protein
LAATCENQDYFVPQRLVLQDRAVFEPRSVDIFQPYRGLNSIDFSIVNTGDQPRRFGIVASVCNQTDSSPCSEPDTTRLAASREPLAPGERFSDRINESDLGLGDQMHVEFMCYAPDPDSEERCTGTLTYVIQLRQVECRVDSECAGDETCDTTIGLCRREAQTDEGCRHIAGTAQHPSFWYWAGLGLIFVLCRRHTE